MASAKELNVGDRVYVNENAVDRTKVGFSGDVVWVKGEGVWVALDGIGGRYFAAQELDHG